MKPAIQNFRLPEETKTEFNELCKKNYTTASAELSRFVDQRIKELKNLKPI